jgi:hypothetical protein
MKRLFADRGAWTSGLVFLAMVFTLWLPFNLRGGMPYETGFVYTSEISTWWNGFLFGADLLRMHTSTFFQVPYLLGKLFGVAGSWVPFQIVFAALWWARGFLMFLIARRLLPANDLFAYSVGGLALIHSSDISMLWVGQMPQLAFIFWLLTAIYLLICASDATERLPDRVFAVLAILCEYVCLWTYESPIVIILVAPMLLLCLRRRLRPTWLAAWYTIAAIYLLVNLVRYLRTGGHTYQESVLRKDWTVSSIWNDLIFNVSASLKFWTWPGDSLAKAPENQLMLYATIVVLILLAGMLILAGISRANGGWIPRTRTLLAAMVIGLLLLVCSFPAYLILDSSRSLWRTQMLSSLGAAVLLGFAICLCAKILPGKWAQLGVAASLTAIIAGYGSFSALKKGAYHQWIWQRHQHLMEQVLHVAPKVKPGTLVILTNVPRDSEGDAFASDNMWFDMALRLAYPGTAVAGVYSYADGSLAPDNNLQVDTSGRWALKGNPLLSGGGADNILVIAYADQGRTSIAGSLPGFVANTQSTGSYNPAARIESGPPSPLAVRRYESESTAR